MAYMASDRAWRARGSLASRQSPPVNARIPGQARRVLVVAQRRPLFNAAKEMQTRLHRLSSTDTATVTEL